ncbi:MAG: cytochrome c oxidase subunit II [Arcobacter sp.]|nr:MAG: cytochrome c oxidase subunit II [Arcobacter sp.]
MLEGIKGVSSYAANVDEAFIVVTVITLFLFVVTVGSMLYFVYRYRSSKNDITQTKNIKHYTPLEIAWTVIPSILMMIIFYYGLDSLRVQRTMPNDKDSIVVKVLAQRWSWQFEYANGKKSPELTVPVNAKVKLLMTAPKDDVLHSFFVPAFRAKEDVVPGQITKIWFESQSKGKFDILCAEYCGTRHSFMKSFVNVVSQEEYDNFMNPPKKQEKKSAIEILTNNGCIGCHSLEGERLVGPTFKDTYNKDVVVLENGVKKTIKKDEKYLINSILNPKEQVVDTYPNIMPSFKGLLEDEDIKTIINFLKGVEETKAEPEISGLEIIQNNGCTGCHSLDGSKIIGPSFKGIYNRETSILKDGKKETIKIDDKYLKDSIIYPKKEVVENYPNIMPSFDGVLNDAQMDAVINYLKGLK